MSSDRPSDAPSPERGPEPELDLASLVRVRGGPLLDALERHLPGSLEHARATAAYAFAAAVGLGFERSQCEVAREAAMLHEVGLIYVPAAIAGKPASARDEREAETWGENYESAYRLTRGAGIPEHVCGWLLRTRESYDGSGPQQLAAEQIPIESRLIRAACACQTALASTPGDDRLPVRAALETLAVRAGADLDPRVVVSLSSILEGAAQ